MMKRFLAFVLTFFMLLSAMPMDTLAAGSMDASAPGDGYEVTMNEEESTQTSMEQTAPDLQGHLNVQDEQSVQDGQTVSDNDQTVSDNDQSDPASDEQPYDVDGDLPIISEAINQPAVMSFDRNTGYPTDLNDRVYLAVYNGTDFPGEPAWYGEAGYTYFNGNLNPGDGTYVYATHASSVLKPEILDVLTQGPTTGDGVRVWGYYNAGGTKGYFVDGSALLSAETEATIIRRIKGNNVNVDDYKLIWYVIKFQTDTYWHIDGLVVEADKYNVNYYGNGNTSGGAPNGATGLPAGYEYTVLGNIGNLRKIHNGYEFTFLGWNTEPDGSGTHYDPGDIIIITEDVSLYAQWQPPMIDITVTKVWDDNNDQDGIRPDSISIHLLQNNAHYGTPVVLSAANNWTSSWNVPAVTSTGGAIAYHVEETVPEGYTCEVTGNVTDGFTLTNTHTPEKTNAIAHKVWNDNNDQDGIRPASVTLQLYKNVGTSKTAVGSSVSVDSTTSWVYQWSDLMKYEDGAEIVYSVEETSVPAGYTVSYSEDETGRLVVTNTHEIETTSITANKVWNDNNDQDGIRPDSVTLTICADGISTGQTVTVTPDADGNWTATVNDLPKYVNGGTEIVYTLIEENVPAGYTASASGTTVTNTHIPETTAVTVTKTWDDNNNQDGIRPASITAVVTGSDGESYTVVLDAANSWTATVSNLPKYANGTEITYIVSEPNVPDGYTAGINGHIITNTHVPEVVDLTVSKAWNDADNQDGKRPYAVVITLYVNGEPTLYTATLAGTADNLLLSHTWEDMPKYESGKAISYTVVETGYYATAADYPNNLTNDATPPGYTVKHSYDTHIDTAHPNPTAVVTNSYTPETIGLNVQKKWDDEMNQDGMQPASVTFKLWMTTTAPASGNVKPSSETGWTPVLAVNGNQYSVTMVRNADGTWLDVDFTGLPKYSDGKLIYYGVVEDAVEGYESDKTTYAMNPSTGVVTVTNVRTPDKTSVSVTKEWNDANNQDGKRPDSVTVTLYANGEATTNTATLSESNNWTHTWTELDKNFQGKAITYSVVEDAVSDYTTAYTNTADGITVTNTHIPETTQISVSKNWDDAQNQDNKRPASITLILYKGTGDNKEEVKRYNLTSDENWRYTFTDLPKYEGGQEIVYSVDEITIEGYTGTVEKNGNDISITNTHVPETIDVVATKIWDDSDNQDGVRPESITLYLLRSGVLVDEKTVTPDADGNWTVTWNDLPKYSSGTLINYTVAEKALDDYAVSYLHDRSVTEITATITNSRQTEKTVVNVEKVWDDSYNQDGKRPVGVRVELYADNVATGKTIDLNQTNGWTGSFTDLDVHKEGAVGNDIEYTVVEIGYINADGEYIAGLVYGSGSVVYSTDQITGELEVINKYTPETVDVSISKIWDDADNQDGIRPGSVEVELYADGEPTGKTMEVTGTGNTWTATFEDLPKYSRGTEIVYSIEEVNTPEGYTAVAAATTVTNSHTPAVISVPVYKVWDDNHNQDGIRPDSVTVTLYADGTAIQTQELSVSTNWAGSFDNLPKYQNGTVIIYTVGEAASDVPDGYTASVDGNTITNTHIPEEVDLNVEKVWNDADNQDGKRPAAVQITLYVDGLPTEYTLKLDAGNNWKGSWDNMPKYEGGALISYTVVETGHYDTAEGELINTIPEGYTVTHSYNTADENFDSSIEEPKATVTNSYTPESTGLNVQKNWVDDNNRDGLQPESITVKLVRSTDQNAPLNEWADVLDADGQPITATLTAEGQWDADFVGLPKFTNGGTRLYYSVVEEAVEGYTTTYSLNPDTGVVTVTNTHVTEKTSVTVTKVWDDENNQDGIRPASVTVTLYENGVITDKTAVLSEDNDWSYIFEDLNKNIKGSAITYTVVEDEVAGYTTSYTNNADGIIVTNVHTPATVSIPVSKTWDDNNNQDGIRPESITVTLYADGKATADTLTLTAADNWQGAFLDLPQFANGKEIVYSIEEAVISGYNVDENGEAQALSVKVVDGRISITNTHEVEKTTLTAIKVWDDCDNQDGKRPESIKVHLLADGVHMGEEFVRQLSEDNNWTYTWTDLDKYTDGEQILYTVFEEIHTAQAGSEDENAGIAPQIIEDYIASYTRDSETQITITNTYIPETTVISAMKIWDDDDNRDGLRPESVAAELYRVDGENTVKVAGAETLILNEDNDWVDSWRDLPKYENHGVEIQYVVVENNVPTGYESSIVREEEYAPGLFLITNTHTPATTGVTVTKVWDDEDNNDGKRPDGIIVQLYANDSAIERAEVVLNDANDWTYTWSSTEELPMYIYEQGELIAYDVRETGYVINGKEYTGLPEGYVGSTNTGDNEYSISITNTRATEKISVNVVKQWQDADNNDRVRPASVSVTLLKNGTPVDTVTLSADNSWSHTWSNLYKYAGGVVAEYTVKEAAVNAYTASYSYTKSDDGKLITATVTNTHNPANKQVVISKVWNDNGNIEGLRPESVTVQLYKNGNPYGEKITLSDANNWRYPMWLPVYENGVGITWTVEEINIPRYYTVSYDQSTLTVTNTIQSKEVPKTGDLNNLWLWILLLGGSSAGALFVVFYDRKKKKFDA